MKDRNQSKESSHPCSRSAESGFKLTQSIYKRRDSLIACPLRGVRVIVCVCMLVCARQHFIKTETNSRSVPIIYSTHQHLHPPNPYNAAASVSVCNRMLGGGGRRGKQVPHLLHPPLFGLEGRNPSGLKAAKFEPGENVGATCRRLKNLTSQWGQGAEGAGIGRWRMAVLLFLYNKRGSL